MTAKGQVTRIKLQKGRHLVKRGEVMYLERCIADYCTGLAETGLRPSELLGLRGVDRSPTAHDKYISSTSMIHSELYY
jgi:hypothetical protein